MKKELEELLAKIEWEGDLLYVLENYEDMVPDDIVLQIHMENLHSSLKSFKTRLSKLCIEHEVDPEQYDY